MMHESDTALVARLSALLIRAEKPADVAGAMQDFLRAVCDRLAQPTDGLSKGQSSLIWQRQIALTVAADTCGVEGPRREILEIMADGERTVWDDRELERLADMLADQASELAEEWRGEAEVIRGEI